MIAETISLGILALPKALAVLGLIPVEKMSFALPVEKRNTHHHAMVLYFTPAWLSSPKVA
jgi:hypothetical protein